MGASLTDQVDRLRAALADRYQLEEEIGRGGMACVYRAHDRRHGRDVAIKVLRPELSAALGAERFLREIRIAARLQHPHILPLYDSGSADGFLYYVMPCMRGETLRDRLRREKQLPLATTLRIAAEVAAGAGPRPLARPAPSRLPEPQKSRSYSTRTASGIGSPRSPTTTTCDGTSSSGCRYGDVW